MLKERITRLARRLVRGDEADRIGLSSPRLAGKLIRELYLPERLTTVEAGMLAQPRTLQENTRIPINVWGDVLLDGSQPQVRRVLTGIDAHESLLSFFYFNEMLTLIDAVQALPELERRPGRPSSILDRYAALQEAVDDPCHHFTDEILRVFLPSTLYFQKVGAENTELCELGCTFFSAIEKMKICASVMDAQIDFSTVRFAGVDHSDYFRRGTRILHPLDNVLCYNDFAEWKPSTPHPFHLSRFVASYALDSTDAFASWMENFSAFHVIDVVNLEATDFQTENNGLKQIFFNLPGLVARLEQAGWRLYLNEITPDFNSGRRCAVIKLFGVRRELDEEIGWSAALGTLTELRERLPFEVMSAKTAEEALDQVDRSLEPHEWETLREYKRHFPIWGPPFPPVHSIDEVQRLVSHPGSDLVLTFEGGQINAAVRQALDES